MFLEGRVVVDGLTYGEILARQKEEVRAKEEAVRREREQEEMDRRLQEEEAARMLAEKEAKRKEVVVGMLFRRKDGVVKAFVEAYPKGVALSRIAKELPSLIEVEYVEGVVNGRQRQVGSLAGAAHLLNDNTGVLRSAQ